MKQIIAAFLCCLFIATPLHARELPEPKLIAVYFYADWCPKCKLLSPMMAQVRGEHQLDRKNILFVTLNLTDKPAIHQSILLAQTLGMGDYLKAQGSATGYIALLDPTDMQELARFDSSNKSEEIADKINTLLAP